jgi:hypothetical protein
MALVARGTGSGSIRRATKCRSYNRAVLPMFPISGAVSYYWSARFRSEVGEAPRFSRPTPGSRQHPVVAAPDLRQDASGTEPAHR